MFGLVDAKMLFCFPDTSAAVAIKNAWKKEEKKNLERKNVENENIERRNYTNTES